MRRRSVARHRRRGGILVVAIISLLVTSLVLASLVKMTGLQHRQQRGERDFLQADWLAESAIDRAAARLAGDLNYTSEVWEVPAEQMGGQEAGQVTIEVSSIPEKPSHRRVSVTANYPVEKSSRSIKRSKQAVVRVNAQP